MLIGNLQTTHDDSARSTLLIASYSPFVHSKQLFAVHSERLFTVILSPPFVILCFPPLSFCPLCHSERSEESLSLADPSTPLTLRSG